MVILPPPLFVAASDDPAPRSGGLPPLWPLPWAKAVPQPAATSTATEHPVMRRTDVFATESFAMTLSLVCPMLDLLLVAHAGAPVQSGIVFPAMPMASPDRVMRLIK
jgi:hypothetical protein